MGEPDHLLRLERPSFAEEDPPPHRHCEHSDRCFAPSAHKLREASQRHKEEPDCFVAIAPRNDSCDFSVVMPGPSPRRSGFGHTGGTRPGHDEARFMTCSKHLMHVDDDAVGVARGGADEQVLHQPAILFTAGLELRRGAKIDQLGIDRFVTLELFK